MQSLTQEDRQALCVELLPAIREYMRTHQTTIEQVELATVLTGIKTMPVTQTLGGVEKTVRVPLVLLTASVDEAEALAREMAEFAKKWGEYAKAQGDRLDIDQVVADAKSATTNANTQATNAKTQAEYAKAQGDEAKSQAASAKSQADNAKTQAEYAKEQGDYAKAQGASANSIYTTVKGWFEGTGGFKATSEAWIASAKAAWNSWFGTSEDTGVQGIWKTWFAARKTDFSNKLAEMADAITNANDKASYAEAQGAYAHAQGVIAGNQAGSAEQQAKNAAAAAAAANAEAQTLGKLKDDCLDATSAANAAAQRSGEKMAEIDALVKSISGESSAAPVRMVVSLLGAISTKNKEKQRISVQLYPTYVMQNVLYQKVSGTSAMVDPSGDISITGTGESVFWVIPPQNTELWQQVSVNVRAPRIRLTSSGKMRLNRGKIRIV